MEEIPNRGLRYPYAKRDEDFVPDLFWVIQPVKQTTSSVLVLILWHPHFLRTHLYPWGPSGSEEPRIEVTTVIVSVIVSSLIVSFLCIHSFFHFSNVILSFRIWDMHVS